MDPIVIVLLWLTVVALVALGIAGAVLPALPGVPMVFAGLWLGAWIDGYARIGTGTLIVLGVLTALSLLIDFVASALGAKRVGASPKAVTGAVLGSLVGLFFGLPGIILGPFIGAVLGELATQRNFDQATRVGIATWMGLLFGTIAKLVTSLVMVGIFVFAYFF
ncbi:DUF456 domain-containing protein [Sinimarinibacterium flocculans]|uniref:DUF456 domain-containing protein n=1 Tax=Sinimarinibacterium flocculans TaxID=985250 RepID=UPI0024905A2B|nr:DUF456 family protein [Sinimarinibacterium flocculans]